MSDLTKTRLGWLCIALSVPFILYAGGFQAYRYDLTQMEHLAVLWPHCLVFMTLAITGQALLGLYAPRARR